MSTGKIIAICAVVFVLVASFSSINSTYNTAVKHEQGVLAKYKDNEQRLGQFGNRVMEMMKVSDAHKQDVLEVIKGAMKGKYGDDGSTAQFLWSNDAMPPIDASLRKEVMREISGGRKNFEQNQTQLLDMCRVYKEMTKTLVGGTFVGMLGFPKEVNFDTHCEVVSSTYARKAFETKTDDGLQL